MICASVHKSEVDPPENETSCHIMISSLTLYPNINNLHNCTWRLCQLQWIPFWNLLHASVQPFKIPSVLLLSTKQRCPKWYIPQLRGLVANSRLDLSKIQNCSAWYGNYLLSFFLHTCLLYKNRNTCHT